MSAVMPRGVPLRVCASVVPFSRRSGLTKLKTTRFADGRPSPRSISQWLLWSKSVMSRTLPHRQASLEQCQAPYTCGGVGAAATAAWAGPAAGPARKPNDAMAVRRIRIRRMAALQPTAELIVSGRIRMGNRGSQSPVSVAGMEHPDHQHLCGYETGPTVERDDRTLGRSTTRARPPTGAGGGPARASG